MARGTRTVYPGKRNKGLSSTFQPPEEGRSLQRPKRCDKHGDKDEDNSLKNVNNVHNTSSQKYRQIAQDVLENPTNQSHVDLLRQGIKKLNSCKSTDTNNAPNKKMDDLWK